MRHTEDRKSLFELRLMDLSYCICVLVDVEVSELMKAAGVSYP